MTKIAPGNKDPRDMPVRRRHHILFAAFVATAYLSTAWAVRAEDDRDDVDDLFSPQELRAFSRELEGFAATAPGKAFTLKIGGEPDYGGVYGIDISHHVTDCNGTEHCSCEVDWDLVYRHNARFVYLKATTGRDTPDQTFPTNWGNLKALHERGQIYRGAYHWLSSNPGSSAKEQAEYFLSVVKPTDPQLPPALDFEADIVGRSVEYYQAHQNDSVCSKHTYERKGKLYHLCDGWADIAPADKIQKIKTWLATVANATHRRPFVYTRKDTWDALGAGATDIMKSYPVWIARWPKPPFHWHDQKYRSSWHMPPLPVGAAYPPPNKGGAYRSSNFWQFTEAGVFEKSPVRCKAGTAKDGVDMDWYPSGENDFRREFGVK
jgi:GH25 family lysozyme M1 (1,4-beta-N-acetylmuramidase)